MTVKFDLYNDKGIKFCPEFKNIVVMPAVRVNSEDVTRISHGKDELLFSEAPIEYENGVGYRSIHILSQWNPKIGDKLHIVEESPDGSTGSNSAWKIDDAVEDCDLRLRHLWLVPDSLLDQRRFQGTDNTGPG